MDNIIFLDIDGVLINIFPPWRADEVDEDGYSKFNETLTANLQSLLGFKPDLKVVLSSSRRIGKDLSRLEAIFAFRGIKGKLIDKIPDPDETHLSRAQEISRYIDKHRVKNFLIIDDDKSLLQLSERYQKGLILTNYREGFNAACLKAAMAKIEAWQNGT
ncbi:MAG: hypothetical protein GVY26_04595 [Bacteroidetes bacterium]|jgi:hypothetical protein|nr:hypothetical protein [Bacteroidota bacterium]